MDEIICPICGKQNITSSANCRYCQAPLSKMDKSGKLNKEDELFETNSLQAHSTNVPPQFKPVIDNEVTQEENLPDWLKRVRELKKADEAKEREKEQWRQHDLFNQEGQKQKHKLSSVEKKSDSTPQKNIQVKPETAAEIKMDDRKETESREPPPESEIKKSDNENSVIADDDLPEGFIPFQPQGNNPYPNKNE